MVGRFNSFNGSSTWDESDAGQRSLEITIQTESVDTGRGVHTPPTAFPVHICNCDNVLRLTVAGDAEGAPTRAYSGDVQFLIGRLVAQCLKRRSTAKSACWNSSCQLLSNQEMSSGNSGLPIRH